MSVNRNMHQARELLALMLVFALNFMVGIPFGT